MRASSYFERAMEHKRKREHDKAIEKMQLAIKEDPRYIEAYSVLGEWYYQARKYREAASLFETACKAFPENKMAFAKPLAKSLLGAYDYNRAQTVITDNMVAWNKAEWKHLQEQAFFMQKAMKTKWKDTVRNLGSRINSRYAEMFPRISTDTATLYLTRKVNGIDEDLFVAKVDSCGGWFKPLGIGSPINSSDHESGQMVSGDEHYMFFSRCGNRSDNGWDQGECDLFMAYTADSTWSVPQSFGATINTPAYEGMPCLSPDNRELYFVSNRPGGYGGLDIWVSRFQDGFWQVARNLGPTINTKGNETAPFLHIDNNTLYFSSDSLVGLGGTDLFFCRRTNDTCWGAPQNMGYPFNTTANEHSISITVDGTKAFLSSDRDSVLGNFDIYEINMPQQMQPIPVAIIKGFTYDSISSNKLNYTRIYINDANTGNQLYHFISNRGDGSYMITLPVGNDYVYNADRIGYMEITDTIRLMDKDATQDLNYNIPLLPQGYQAPVHDSLILTINFQKNTASLTDSNKTTIKQLLDPWLSSANIRIMVNGYTDNTGTPMINEQLSYMRAGLISKELSTLGFDPSIIQTYGWGDAEPLTSNDSEEGQNINRRVEVVIRQ